MFSISLERPEHAAAIASLLAEAFPPPATKPIERFRAGRAPFSELGRVALVEDTVVGSVRFWPAAVREYRSGRLEEVLILGPLAVTPDFSGAGLGSALVRSGLAAAQAAGHAAVLLTGDAGYYRRFGFCRQLANGIALAGEAPDRLLARELVPGVLGRLTGTLVPARCVRSAHRMSKSDQRELRSSIRRFFAFSIRSDDAFSGLRLSSSCQELSG